MQARDVEVEELPVPGDAGDLEPLQRRDRRVVGLQDAERSEVHARDHAADRALGEEGGQRLHLRQLGHLSSVPHRPSPDRQSHARSDRRRRSGQNRTERPTSETTPPWPRHRLSPQPRQQCSPRSSLVLAAFVTGAATAGPAGATSVEDTFTAKLNYARASRGIPRLAARSALVTVARAQAHRMAEPEHALPQPEPHHRRHELALGRRERRLRPGRPHRARGLHAERRRTARTSWTATTPRSASAPSSSTAGSGSPRCSAARCASPPARWPRSASTLRYGSTGAAVKRVQGRLNLRQTGYYGTYTRSAVSRFQKAQGWTGRGNVGPQDLGPAVLTG